MELPEQQKQAVVHHGGGADAVYGIGMFGAWVYYFRRATTTEERVKAFLKGLVWPAFLVYELFTFLDVAKPVEMRASAAPQAIPLPEAVEPPPPKAKRKTTSTGRRRSSTAK